jgi:myosin heavy subunit
VQERDGQLSIAGARIINYLLEKSRITAHSTGERNFHIFYALLRGANANLLAHLTLDNAIDSYAYLRGTAQIAARDVHDS